MNNFQRIFFMLPAVLICLIGFALPVRAMDLDEIIRLALECDAQLQADTFAAEARNADGWQAVAAYGPSLTASGSYMASRDASKPESGAEEQERLANFTEGVLTVGLTQPVIDLEKLNRTRQGLAEMDVAALLKKKAREDLLLKVHERYYAALSAREALRLARAESAALFTQVRNAEEKLELGYGTITDQYDADARYRLALAAEIAGQKELDDSLKALEELIDRRIVAELDDPAADMVLPTLSGDADGWLKISHAQNTDLGLNQLQAQTAMLQYREAQSRFLPSLVFFADYNERQSTDGLLGYGEERSEFDVGLRVQADLLAGGRDAAAAVAASRRAKAAMARTTAAKRAVNRSVHSLWDSIASTRELVAAYQQSAAANEKALESTRTSYEEGVKVLLDVLNAQQDYYRSLRQFRTSRYDYMVLLEKFRQVVGVESVLDEEAILSGSSRPREL
jgi:outer membrane protein